jgi:Domain of unknown function (DUF4604)
MKNNNNNKNTSLQIGPVISLSLSLSLSWIISVRPQNIDSNTTVTLAMSRKAGSGAAAAAKFNKHKNKLSYVRNVPKFLQKFYPNQPNTRDDAQHPDPHVAAMRARPTPVNPHTAAAEAAKEAERASRDRPETEDDAPLIVNLEEFAHELATSGSAAVPGPGASGSSSGIDDVLESYRRLKKDELAQAVAKVQNSVNSDDSDALKTHTTMNSSSERVVDDTKVGYRPKRKAVVAPTADDHQHPSKKRSTDGGDHVVRHVKKKAKKDKKKAKKKKDKTAMNMLSFDLDEEPDE